MSELAIFPIVCFWDKQMAPEHMRSLVIMRLRKDGDLSIMIDASKLTLTEPTRPRSYENLWADHDVVELFIESKLTG